jgi:ribonucleoside-diphosphate reductase alpha chain
MSAPFSFGDLRQAISEMIWREKYRAVSATGESAESSPADTHARVCAGVYANDPQAAIHAPLAQAAMDAMEWCPGGRILAGAGTGRAVTMINCFVNDTVPDSMAGIMAANTRAALTMQQGGGIGTDFSTIRPKGALVEKTGSIASGPISFMEIWQAMCGTIMSGGTRRGAMMGTLSDDHPDLPDFIAAKQQPGRLSNFNISVLVSDALMRAVDADADWDLGFAVPPADSSCTVAVKEKDGKPWYVYDRMPARALWDRIVRATYDAAEPGVIFIDRVNAANNLSYAETIRCTNPCGEQPLPPNGACNLGCVNLAALVKDPFGEDSRFDFARLTAVAAIGVRFLDNVLDATHFPVPEQAAEAQAKRRTGIGIMGLGTALQMLGLRYGTEDAEAMTARIMETLRDGCYAASVELAKERGPFPLFDKDAFCDRPFIHALPQSIRDGIAAHGIRNGVLLTIAPTGTTALYSANVSSGLEPTFGWRYFRKVLQADGSQREFAVLDAGFLGWCRVNGFDPETHPLSDLPPYMVTALELSVEEHLRTQAVCQRYVDASISKTINCPTEMDFDAFKAVYARAYELGCKGCTTYRPSPLRKPILSTEASVPATAPTAVPPRPEALTGTTYKLKWPLTDENFYVTINDIDAPSGRRPFEIFIASRSAEHAELLSALTITLSAIMRRTEDASFLIEDLQTVRGATGAWVNGRYVNGIVALIAEVMRRHMADLGLIETDGPPATDAHAAPVQETPLGDVCPQCHAPTLFRQEGCKKCLNCGYSTCG